MANLKKRGLGKGLDALLSGRPPIPAAVSSTPPPLSSDEPVAEGDRVLHLDPRLIEPNPKQPRSVFNEEALDELAESIRQEGVQEPIIVRRRGEIYELVSGERRVRASIMADQETVPAICREVSDTDMLRLGLIENIQREDLNAIELAQAYQKLIEEFGWTQEELADHVGKKRATVANMLRLLHLPDEVQRDVAEGKISMGHARALLAIDDPKALQAACRKVIIQGLSVRQTEQLSAPPNPAKPKPHKDPDIAGLEDELRRALGTRVSVHPSGKSKGRIEIEYYNLDDLERILDIVRRK